MRSRVETALVSNSAAFFPYEQCVLLSQQRRFRSGCWSYPTKGVKLDHSLLMKLPFCCCCCLFCEQTVSENLPVFSRGLGDSWLALWVTTSLLGASCSMLGCQRTCAHVAGMYVYICTLLEHNTFDKGSNCVPRL